MYVRAFWRDKSGAALAEYSILVALIAVVAVTAVGLVGTQVNNQYQSIITEWRNATPNSVPAQGSEKQKPTTNPSGGG